MLGVGGVVCECCSFVGVFCEWLWLCGVEVWCWVFYLYGGVYLIGLLVIYWVIIMYLVWCCVVEVCVVDYWCVLEYLFFVVCDDVLVVYLVLLEVGYLLCWLLFVGDFVGGYLVLFLVLELKVCGMLLLVGLLLFLFWIDFGCQCLYMLVVGDLLLLWVWLESVVCLLLLVDVELGLVVLLLLYVDLVGLLLLLVQVGEDELLCDDSLCLV